MKSNHPRRYNGTEGRRAWLVRPPDAFAPELTQCGPALRASREYLEQAMNTLAGPIPWPPEIRQELPQIIDGIRQAQGQLAAMLLAQRFSED